MNGGIQNEETAFLVAPVEGAQVKTAFLIAPAEDDQVIGGRRRGRLREECQDVDCQSVCAGLAIFPHLR